MINNKTSNTEWYINEIQQADSLDRLEYLAEVISFDVDIDGEDQFDLQKMRREWNKRKQELTK